MKIAPLIKAIQEWNELTNERLTNERSLIQYRLVHTGQHYDKNMSDTFFEELGIPAPDVNLGCGGGTQAEQTAAIMVAFEKELMAHPTDVVLVVGDVTSTMACSIVAKKLNTKVCHVEAGIRSWDLTMPESGRLYVHHKRCGECQSRADGKRDEQERMVCGKCDDRHADGEQSTVPEAAGMG